MNFIYLLFLILPNAQAANEACSREATVNFQKILVDPSTNKKGEGLRFYLNKDPVAQSYLDRYQSAGLPQWQTAALSTIGVGLLGAGIIQVTGDEGSTEDRIKRHKYFLMGGVSFLVFNFIISNHLYASSTSNSIITFYFTNRF